MMSRTGMGHAYNEERIGEDLPQEVGVKSWAAGKDKVTDNFTYYD